MMATRRVICPMCLEICQPWNILNWKDHPKDFSYVYKCPDCKGEFARLNSSNKIWKKQIQLWEIMENNRKKKHIGFKK